MKQRGNDNYWWVYVQENNATTTGVEQLVVEDIK